MAFAGNPITSICYEHYFKLKEEEKLDCLIAIHPNLHKLMQPSLP